MQLAKTEVIIPKPKNRNSTSACSAAAAATDSQFLQQSYSVAAFKQHHGWTNEDYFHINQAAAWIHT
jgi:AraC-like DNA-binding protein